MIPEKKLNAVSGGNVIRPCRGPRTVSLQRCDHGFGFTLRHFIVYPPDVSTRSDSDGSDSGVPHGGEKFRHVETSALEPMDTIFVKHVKDGSPAQKAGLTTGDRVVSVNGETVAGKSYSQVVQLIQRSGSTLQLLVVPKEDDILQLYFPSTAYRSSPDDHRHPQEGGQRQCTGSTQATSSNQAPSRLITITTSSSSSTTTTATTSLATASSRQDLIAQTHPSSAKDTRTMVSSGIPTGYATDNTTAVPLPGDVGRRRFSDLPSLFRNEVASMFPGRSVAPSSAGSLGPPRAGSTWSVATVGLGLGLGIGLNFGTGRGVANGDADRARSAFDLSSPSTDACKTTVAGSSSTVTVYSVGAAPRFATVPSDGSLSEVGDRLAGDDHHHLPSTFPALVPCPPAEEYLASTDLGVCKASASQPGSTTVSSRESSAERLDATTDSIINRLKASFEKKEEFLLRSTPPGSGATPADFRMTSSAPSSLNGSVVREYYPHPHKFATTPQWPPSSSSGSSAELGLLSSSSDSFASQNSRQAPHPGSIRAAPDGEAEEIPLCRPGKAFVSNLSRIQENIPTQDQRDAGDSLRPSQIRPLVETTNGVVTSNASSSSSGDSPPFSSLSSSCVQKTVGDRSGALRYNSLRKASSLDSELLPPRTSPTAGTSSTVNGGRMSGVNSSSGSTASMDCTVDAGRVSALHLVSQRARQFEMGALQQEANNRMNLYRNELARLTTRGKTPSVSDRAAQFESLSTSQETLASESDYSQSPRSKPPLTTADSWKDGALSKIVLQRSLDSQLTRSNGSYSTSAQDSTVDVPQSASSDDNDLHRHKAVRQNSYLAAVKAPYTESHPTGSVAPISSGSAVDPSVPPGRIVLRRKAIYEDGVHNNDDQEDSDGRLMRRVSYLRATASSDDASVVERNARWSLKEDEDVDEDTGSDADGRMRRGRLLHRQHPGVAPRDNQLHYNYQYQNHRQEQEQRRLQSQPEPGKPNGAIHQGAPRSQSTQKLKAFFGERTPQVPDVSEKSPLSEICLSPVEVFREGWLNCKVAACEGKRATDRSWKQTWAVLKGSCLALYRDKKDVAHQILATVDEQPIDLKSCQVDVASDYSKKKKHVFRLVTSSASEYLLQADSGSDMQQWIRAIQDGLDVNGKGVISQGIVMRKSALFESGVIAGGGSGHLSPQPGPKGIRKLTTFRNRSPTGHSPTSKTRKSSQGDDTSPKSKTWRGKMVKTIRKIHGTSPPSALQPEGVTVGVPLEDCPPSAANEFVPLLVELCTSIVEARGLEVIGIYRVPGNTAAVSFLLDAVNHGFESLNLQDPKWSDVNVISSLLKAFFRKLPDPLVTCELYPHFIEASKTDDPVQRMYDLKKMLHELPDHNYETLRYLIRHLQKVVAHSSVNKMEARNLAIVFGPTLVRAADDNMVTMVTDMSFQCRIVEMFITHANWFFSTDENEDVANQNFPLSEREAADVGVPRPISNQNQLLLNNLQKMEHVHQGGESKLKDVTAKDLVSSIIGAANRKVRQKMKKHHHHHNQHEHHLQQSSHRHSEPDVEERDIDREIELRLRRLEPDRGMGTGTEDRKSDNVGLKVERRHSEDSSTSSFSTSRTTSEDCTSPRKMSVDSLDGFQQATGIPTRIPVGAGDRERAFCVVRQASSSSSASFNSRLQARSGALTPTVESTALTVAGVSGRPTAVRKDGDQGSNGTSTADGVLKTYAGLSASMQERIRQFELETRALLKRDAQNRQKGQERRELDRQRIEIEWQRAKRDMEQDDFLDRLADDPSVAKKISDITQKIQNLHNSHLRLGGEQWSPPSSSSSTASKGGSASSFEHDLDSLPFIDSTVPALNHRSPAHEVSPSQVVLSNDQLSDDSQIRHQLKQPSVLAQGPDRPPRRDMTTKGCQSAMKRVSSAESFVACGDHKEWRGRQHRPRTRSCGRSSASTVSRKKVTSVAERDHCPTDSNNTAMMSTSEGNDLEHMSKWCGSLDSLREFYETTIQDESSTSRAPTKPPRQLHSSPKKTDTSSKNSDWVSRHPRVPPYQPPPAPPLSSSVKPAAQKMDLGNQILKEQLRNPHHHYHWTSVGNESTTSTRSVQDLGFRPWSPQRGRRPMSMEDVRFHRNENTLIKATMSTSSHTISSTSTTAVMTATITSKSSRPTDAASSGSWCTFHDTSVACPSFGHCQALSPTVVNPEKKIEGQKRVLQSVVCENGIKKGRATPISCSSTSQLTAPLPHVRKSSHLRNLKRRHTVGGTKDFEKFRVLADDRSPEDENGTDQWLDPAMDMWHHSENLSDDSRSVKSRLRRQRTQISSPDLHGTDPSETLLLLSSKCRPEKHDVTDRTLGSAVQVDESRTVRNDTKKQGSLESQV